MPRSQLIERQPAMADQVLRVLFLAVLSFGGACISVPTPTPAPSLVSSESAVPVARVATRVPVEPFALSLDEYIRESSPIFARHSEKDQVVALAAARLAVQAGRPNPANPAKSQEQSIFIPTPERSRPVSLNSLSTEEIVRSLTTKAREPSPVIPDELGAELRTNLATLERATREVEFTIEAWSRLSPPPEARPYHEFVAGYFVKSRDAYVQSAANRASLLARGYIDERDRFKATALILEEAAALQRAEAEFDRLSAGKGGRGSQVRP